MSAYKELLEKIAKVQEENKNLKEFPLLCEVKEPGKTGFICKKGDLLLCPIEVKKREKKIIVADTEANKHQFMEDFMGIDPFIALVMESGCDDVQCGDVVHIDIQTMKNAMRNVIVCQAAAIVLPYNYIVGINNNLS